MFTMANKAAMEAAPSVPMLACHRPFSWSALVRTAATNAKRAIISTGNMPSGTIAAARWCRK